MEAALRSIRAELKSIRSELNDLTEKVDNILGYRKEIDHALERIAAIEKHLTLPRRNSLPPAQTEKNAPSRVR